MADVDVIVIGAGIIGAAVAFEVAATGRRVRVIEARAVARGATHASAGVLSPYIEGHESGALCRLGRRSLDLYDDFIARVTQAAGRAVVYQRSGTIEVALDEAHAATLRQSAASLTREGVEARWLEPSELARLEPDVTASAAGGLAIAMHGFVAAVDLTQALIDAARAHGAIVEHGTRVSGIESVDGRVRVSTDAGRWEANHLVIAAGSWSGQIEVTGASPAPIRPVRGQLLALRQPVPTLHRVIWGAECYLVPWPDGTVLVGATMEEVGFDERATLRGVAQLSEAARRLVPALADASFEGVRVGLRPASTDPLPLVGTSARVPGVIYAAGHFRNGVLLTPLTAQIVRDLVAGGATDPALAPFAPARVGL